MKKIAFFVTTLVISSTSFSQGKNHSSEQFHEDAYKGRSTSVSDKVKGATDDLATEASEFFENKGKWLVDSKNGPLRDSKGNKLLNAYLTFKGCAAVTKHGIEDTTARAYFGRPENAWMIQEKEPKGPLADLFKDDKPSAYRELQCIYRAITAKL
jgi:hypothetical protein